MQDRAATSDYFHYRLIDYLLQMSDIFAFEELSGCR